MSGDFIVINKHLVENLRKTDLWNKKLAEKLVSEDGIILDIDEIPNDIKNLHKGAFEIDPKHQIEIKGRRIK